MSTETEECVVGTHLDREDVVRRYATVVEHRLLRDDRNDSQMRDSDVREVEYLATNGSVDIIRAVLVGVLLELACREDMLRRTDEVPEDSDDEYRATADKPNEHVDSELFSPRLLDIWSLHSPEPPEEGSRTPEGEHPAEHHPPLAKGALLDDLGRLTLLDLACERFLA